MVIVHLSCGVLAILNKDTLSLIKYLPVVVDRNQLNSHTNPDPYPNIPISTSDTHIIVASTS